MVFCWLLEKETDRQTDRLYRTFKKYYWYSTTNTCTHRYLFPYQFIALHKAYKDFSSTYHSKDEVLLSMQYSVIFHSTLNFDIFYLTLSNKYISFPAVYKYTAYNGYTDNLAILIFLQTTLPIVCSSPYNLIVNYGLRQVFCHFH